MQESIDQGAASPGLIFARTGMHAHAGRFVDDSEVVVLVHDIERYVFGKRLERRKLHTPSDDNVLVAVQTQGWFGRDAVHQDLALLDQLLHSDPAYVRQLRNQPMVESLSSGIGRNAQVLDLAWLRQTALSIQQSARLFSEIPNPRRFFAGVRDPYPLSNRFPSACRRYREDS